MGFEGGGGQGEDKASMELCQAAHAERPFRAKGLPLPAQPLREGGKGGGGGYGLSTGRSHEGGNNLRIQPLDQRGR